MGRVRAVVINRIGCRHHPSMLIQRLAGVGIDIEPRKVAAGDLQAGIAAHFILDFPPLQGQNVALGRYPKNQITYPSIFTAIAAT